MEATYPTSPQLAKHINRGDRSCITNYNINAKENKDSFKGLDAFYHNFQTFLESKLPLTQLKV